MKVWDINIDMAFKVAADTIDEALLVLDSVSRVTLHEQIREVEPTEILFIGDEEGNAYQPEDEDFQRCIEAIREV